MGGAMTGNENLGAVSIDLAHVIRDIARDEIRVELQRQLGGLTDGERRILDMWPRFEDGEPVMPYDRVQLEDGDVETLYQVHVGRGGYSLYTETHDEEHPHGHLLKRPARSVLDADGMEIKVGDSMYVANNGDGPYTVCNIDESIDRIELFWHENRNERLLIPANRLTHTRPDSWERLEEDVHAIVTGDGMYHRLNNYCNARDLGGDDVMRLTIGDLVRRAKVLAGVEVDK